MTSSLKKKGNSTLLFIHNKLRKFTSHITISTKTELISLLPIILFCFYPVQKLKRICIPRLTPKGLLIIWRLRNLSNMPCQLLIVSCRHGAILWMQIQHKLIKPLLIPPLLFLPQPYNELNPSFQSCLKCHLLSAGCLNQVFLHLVLQIHLSFCHENKCL